MQTRTLHLSETHHHNAEAIRFIYTDKIVGLLGEFPELTKAVREGNLATVTVLCAKVFESVAASSTMQMVSSPQ